VSAPPAFREPFAILYVRDVQRAIRFYSESLGFEVSYHWPSVGETEFAFLKLDPLGIGVSQRRPEHEGRDFELCVYTDDADRAADRLRAAAAREVQPPQNEPWGERRTYFRDPDGNLVHIAQSL
jgi:catechol 2,3-dioxygenase-like lactoylglutathione lyase family enzyme